MEIADIKQSLEITAVAEQLGIKIDGRSKRALCPFHNDKTHPARWSLSDSVNFNGKRWQPVFNW